MLEKLKSMSIERAIMNAVSDVVKGALLRLEFKIVCSLVGGVGVYRDKILEWLLPLIQGQLLQVVDLTIDSSACHDRRSSDDVGVGRGDGWWTERNVRQRRVAFPESCQGLI